MWELELTGWMRRARHRASRSGFTLIELLVAMLIVGLLMAIVVPQVRRFRDRALVATMKSDLRNFAVLEESYFYDRATYSGDLTAIETWGFQSTSGVTVSINEATLLGWSATATHNRHLIACYIFIGAAAPVGSATVEGSISCS